MTMIDDLITKLNDVLVNSKKISKKKYVLENHILSILSEIKEYKQLYEETKIDDLKISISELETRLKEYVAKENDEVNAIIIEIRPGTGGDEAALFAMDLFKMYTKVCEKHKLKSSIIDIRMKNAGLEFLSCKIEGKNIQDIFKYESGVHRVQRVPETEAQGRIHTSTASVMILEDVSNIQINILPKDLHIETCRASGAGGQHVNKTESAVRVVHIPTGMAVECQDERSQHDNKERAINTLKMRLYQVELEKYHKQRDLNRQSQVSSAKRSEKSRTYNFRENRVTDHIFGITIYALDKVLVGDLSMLTNKMREMEVEEYNVYTELNNMLNELI